MATYQIDWMHEKKVIQAKLEPDFDVRKDIDEFSTKLNGMLDQAETPVSFLFDMTDFNMTFPDMVSAMADLTRGDVAAFRHPKLKELLIVSEQSLMQIGADALQRTQYGKLRSWYFNNMEEAREYLRLMGGIPKQ
jgi:hypothetical protein